MAHVIVERIFDPPLTEDEHMARSLRLFPCLETSSIRWIRSFVSNDRRHGVCEFEAADAETVRIAHRTADVPFVRVWTGREFAPESMPAGD
ncbi:MAG: nickel-binding protein [Longimicrobiales bacterium]